MAKSLLDKLTIYAADHGHVAGLEAFFIQRIEQQVDDDLLKFCNLLFPYSLETPIGDFEWHLIDSKRSPDGKELICLSGYDAVMSLPGLGRHIYSVDQVVNFRLAHLKAALKGDVNRLAYFPIQAEVDPYLKKYLQPVKEIYQRHTNGEKLDDLIGPLQEIVEDLERPNRKRLAKVFKVGFRTLVADSSV